MTVDKACFQHDMAYKDFKDLPRKTTADKLLRDKAFDIAKNSKHDGYQHRFTSIAFKSFDKETSGGAVKSEIMTNQQLIEELQ